MTRATHNYWANFKKIDNCLFRFDTRIYLRPVSETRQGDTCIGAVVGKNPGSALPLHSTVGIGPIAIGDDKLLPTLKSVIEKSYKSAGEKIPERSYIQVLNLFYLCEQDLSLAIDSIKGLKETISCKSESRNFPWVWYMWGNGADRNAKYLNPLKKRFNELRSDHHFFLDKHTSKVEWSVPRDTDFAKHLQGLSHSDVLPSLTFLM